MDIRSINYESTEDSNGEDDQINQSIEEIESFRSDESDDFGASKDNEQKQEILIKINIDSIKKKKFLDRKHLKEEMKLWGAQNKFKLILLTGEKKLVKEQCFISTFVCNKHQEKDCQFRLTFKKSSRENEEGEDEQHDNRGSMYELNEWVQDHNHQLDNFYSSDRMTAEIKEAVQRLRGRCIDDGALTQEINETFKTNFRTEAIHYQTNKLLKKEFGPISEDANTLSKGLYILNQQKKGFYKEK